MFKARVYDRGVPGPFGYGLDFLCHLLGASRTRELADPLISLGQLQATQPLRLHAVNLLHDIFGLSDLRDIVPYQDPIVGVLRALEGLLARWVWCTAAPSLHGCATRTCTRFWHAILRKIALRLYSKAQESLPKALSPAN